MSVTVGLWGPPSAGKTMLLASLYLQADQYGSPWKVFPTPESEGFIKTMRERTRVNGLFPPSTQVGSSESVFLRFSHPATKREASLIVEDRAGKEWLELAEERRRALVETSALMLLFDPLHHTPATFLAEVETTLDLLHTTAARGVEPDRRPVAVCLTKADELVRTPEQLALARDNPSEFTKRWLSERGADSVLRCLDKFCANHRVFPVTSIGMRRVWGAIEPVVFYDEALRPRIGRANEWLSLMRPFEWLFDQVETT